MRRVIATTIIVLSIASVGLVAAAAPAPTASKPTATTTSTTIPKATAIDPVKLYWWYYIKNQETAQRWARFVAAIAAAQRAYPHGMCGGDLPPCYVMWRESRGDIHAQNPRSTASGKWQFLDSTWAGFGGVRKARYADERTQDTKARLLWNHGRGCSHWNACR